MIRKVSILSLVAIVAFCSALAQQGQILQYLSRFTQTPVSFDKGACEVVTYDPATRTAIVNDANTNKLTFINMSNPSAPTFIRDVFLLAYNGAANSIAIKNGVVAVALEDLANKQAPGKVLFLDMNGNYRNIVPVGALPDMLTFTPDGTKVITCNEGEPNTTYTVDPEGSVSIITVNNVTNATVQTVGFTSLNGKQDSLRAMGIRIYGPGSSVAQDFEPEYAAITPDNKFAYVTIQEANAIAIVDLTTASLVRVVALGYKDYNRGIGRTTQYPWNNRPVLGTTAAGQQILLGGFSGLWFEGYGADTNKLRFITHPDRGPNGEPSTIRGVARRPFALPNFQCEVVRFELDRSTGQYTILERVGLTRQDGTTPISGRPNILAAGQGFAFTDELPVDLFGNDIPLDTYGADPEGIVVAADGSWWIVDEYRPAIYNFAPNGVLINRYVAQNTAASVGAAAGTYGVEALPAVYGQRRNNRGFEAVAIEGNILYAFIQSPIDNPDVSNDASSRSSSFCRILAFNVVTKQVVGEYLYPMFETGFSCDKIGDAVSLGNGKFMVAERDDATGIRARKYLFEINLKGATNIFTLNPTLPIGKTIENLTWAELATYGIKPVNKMRAAFLPGVGYGDFDKVEGLTRIRDNQFALINDNDFGVGGSILSNPPDGRITINNSKIPVVGILNFDLPNGLDGSDRDNAAGTAAAINIARWPVYGMYQPDAITPVTVGGENYFLTANEGDARDYSAIVEETRLSAVTLDTLLTNAYPLLKTPQQIGRLNITNVNGDLDGDGDFDQLFTLGGRSFSIWNSDGNLVYDSGNEFEVRTAALFPTNFNAGHTTNAMDDRSDNKGPEPEAITSGIINDSVYAFIGCERIGGTFMYNLTNILAPKYTDYLNTRNFSVTPNLANLTAATPVGDLGPEVITFIPASDSPNNTDLLITGNEVSGTVSVVQVRIPRIVSSPAAVVNACIGDRLTLTLQATGPALAYQWLRNGVAIAGATAATYQTDVVDAPSVEGLYTVRVTAAGGMTISKQTQVNVFSRTQITRQPVLLTQLDTTVSVTLSITTTTGAGETIQWYKAGTALVNGTKYSGVNTPNLFIKHATFADTSSRYYAVVTGGCSTVQSRNSAVLIPRILVSQQPRDTSVCPGDTVYFSTAARPSGGDNALIYQWKELEGPFLKEGGRFTGVNSPNLRIAGVQPSDQRTYVCLISGFPSDQPRITNPAELRVAQPPVIERNLVNFEGGDRFLICQGGEASLSVLVRGDNLTYQWYKNDAAIPGATMFSYNTTTSGRYKVAVTGRCNNQKIFSSEATVVARVEPEIGLDPIAVLAVTQGQTIRLEFTLRAGSPEITYQWYKDGELLPGQNRTVLEITNSEYSDAGSYVCIARNDCGSATTRATVVRVNRPVSVENDITAGAYSIRCEPNPFSANAIIRIGVPVTGPAIVNVVDVQGRVVTTLLNNVLDAGVHTIKLDAESIGASGLYTVQVIHANGTTTEQVVLQR